VPLFTELPRRSLLGNSEGKKRVGAVRCPNPLSIDRRSRLAYLLRGRSRVHINACRGDAGEVSQQGVPVPQHIGPRRIIEEARLLGDYDDVDLRHAARRETAHFALDEAIFSALYEGALPLAGGGRDELGTRL
jgi:hypothetical protein